MQEIVDIINSYKGIKTDEEISSFEGLIKFSTKFYKDVAEIYDCITRIKNTERNPTGFDFNDAAILGILVRIWKILKEIVFYYEKDNGQIISLLDRLVVESAIISKYLLIKGDEVIEDYRKCSYKDRFNILTDTERSPEFYSSTVGVRLKNSIKNKMSAENLTLDSFEQQKRKRWKLSGKTFRDIFKEIEPEEFYKFFYGIGSESIHGSWNESMDFNLIRNDDGTFSTYPFYQKVDIRFVTPIIRLLHDPYLLWLKRIDAEDEYITKVFKWIQSVNFKLFNAFEKVYPCK